MADPGTILITGASGLLGKRLVKKFCEKGWFVFAHYNRRKGENFGACEWIRGDFTTLGSTREFLKSNRDKLMKCTALVNNFGPVTYKDTGKVTSEDLISDLHGNLVVTHEITTAVIRSGNLTSVVNIAFEDVGTVRPYKKILPYAVAKNGVQLLTLSWAEAFPGTRFSLVSPSSIEGGEYVKKGGTRMGPDEVAHEVFEKISGGSGV